ncbi:hypothetical protein QCA50_002018 [Cerrena zonata]|uniref:Uncharacterized protein n=1 Tax=Cerrena zonata TaxID=2478898 RepID=A0AAW0GNR5_9APHY
MYRVYRDGVQRRSTFKYVSLQRVANCPLLVYERNCVPRIGDAKLQNSDRSREKHQKVAVHLVNRDDGKSQIVKIVKGRNALGQTGARQAATSKQNQLA